MYWVSFSCLLCVNVFMCFSCVEGPGFMFIICMYLQDLILLKGQGSFELSIDFIVTYYKTCLAFVFYSKCEVAFASLSTNFFLWIIDLIVCFVGWWSCWVFLILEPNVTPILGNMLFFFASFVKWENKLKILRTACYGLH